MYKQILAALTFSFAVACSQNPVAVAPDASSQQACSGGSVEGDAGFARFAGCRQIDGDLAIRGVTSLEPMVGLARVSGTLSVSDSPELDSLEGLEALDTVGKLVIANNPRLYNLEGLEQLRNVDQLEVAGNARLIGIGALNGVVRAGSVALTDNPRLTAHYGLLRGLEQKPLHVQIEGSRGVTSTELAALKGSTQVASR